jgi:hypothetical protein
MEENNVLLFCLGGSPTLQIYNKGVCGKRYLGTTDLDQTVSGFMKIPNYREISSMNSLSTTVLI